MDYYKYFNKGGLIESHWTKWKYIMSISDDNTRFNSVVLDMKLALMIWDSRMIKL